MSTEEVLFFSKPSGLEGRFDASIYKCLPNILLGSKITDRNAENNIGFCDNLSFQLLPCAGCQSFDLVPINPYNRPMSLHTIPVRTRIDPENLLRL